MATAEEKRARDAAKAAAAQAVVADRARAESRARGSFTGRPLRAAGDLSRYNIGYADDPAAAAREAARRRAAGGGGTGPSRRGPRQSGGVNRPPPPPTRPVRDRAASGLPPSDGSRPPYGTRLYETNPAPRPRLGSPEGSVVLTPKPGARTRAAQGRAPGTIYEGRSDPLTGSKLSDLQAQRRAKFGNRRPAITTPSATRAAQGRAPGTIYEGRGAAETGQRKAGLAKTARKAGAGRTKAAKAAKVAQPRTTAAAQGRRAGTQYEGRGARETGSTVRQNKAAVAKPRTKPAAARPTAKPRAM